MPHTSHKSYWRTSAQPKDKKEVLFKPKPEKVKRTERRDKFRAEVEELEKRIQNEVLPRSGSKPFESIIHPVVYPQATRFDEIPISQNTIDGLTANQFITMTPIQRATLHHALIGRDILGAAKTGSGKTLAFLIPILETLYRQAWSSMDGVGAVILSPTRELATQTFDVLCKIIQSHKITVGLVIGGKDVKDETSYVNGMNIIVATPGRLLHHLEKNPNFSTDTLQILVIDEADKILEIGFKKELDSILATVPKMRQTLLFSATMSNAIRHLTRISLKSPEYISVDESADNATPEGLTQLCITVNAEDKLTCLYGFLKSHLKAKIIIFFETTKEAKYYFEIFRHLRPGIVVTQLHGKMKQMKRLGVFKQFDSTKSGIALFCTSIAARGLDFTNIDWVIQVDCPPNVAEYIHRVGRTARINKTGAALLFLLPSELTFIERLQEKRIPIQHREVNPTRATNITSNIQTIAIAHPEIKTLAKEAIATYMRSVHYNEDKEVFDVKNINTQKIAESYGLVKAPKLKLGAYNGKTVKHDLTSEKDEVIIESNGLFDVPIEETNDEFFVEHQGKQAHEDLGPLTQAQIAQLNAKKKKKSKSKLKFSGKKIKFNDDGEEIIPITDKTPSGNFLERAMKKMKESDKIDRKQYRNSIREKKLNKKLKKKAEKTGNTFKRVVLDDKDDENSGDFEKNNIEPLATKRKRNDEDVSSFEQKALELLKKRTKL